MLCGAKAYVAWRRQRLFWRNADANIPRDKGRCDTGLPPTSLLYYVAAVYNSAVAESFLAAASLFFPRVARRENRISSHDCPLDLAIAPISPRNSRTAAGD